MFARASLLTACAAATMVAATSATARDLPPFKEVAKDYEKVVSTADGSPSLYGLYYNKKKNQLLAELPRGWKGQRYLFAVTQSSGGIFAGLQGPGIYGYWKKYDDRMALIAPEIGTRSTGEAESKSSVKRLFTDRVILDVPIVCTGPSGQPVIDLDALLAGSSFLPRGGRVNGKLVTIEKAKSFPKNLEVEIELPTGAGVLTRFHYSISHIPDNTGYKPRKADERIGYFTTVYRDLGQYKQDEKWVRYIDRWHLEKRDPKLKLSPPKEPIVYYIEHTVPVRYRRWIRQGIEFWNDAFRKVGLEGAIEVRYQDKVTGAHMEKDPEDVRYNFIRWLNNDISTAIGPHRAHPLTGQILDADVVLTDGWIRAYWGWYHEDAPELGVESFSAETLEWLESNPDWDPRLQLASPAKRKEILSRRVERNRRIAAGEISAEMPFDSALLENPELAAIQAWTNSGNIACNHYECLAAHGLASNMTFAQASLETLDLLGGMGDGEDGEDGDEGQMLDDIPEWFIGPFVAELVCHEVGHTLGLRHNFKSSAIYTLEQINSEAWKGKTIGGSVMDYLPPNFNLGSGEVQGDFAMTNIGPYDFWAIEYGYTFGDTDKVLSRVGEPELVYLTDDDTGGPDPLARRYDFSAEPLDFANNQMRIVDQQRANLIEKLVHDGQSWSKARTGYNRTLSQQVRMISMMANWIGGSDINRARKGDVEDLVPVSVVDAAAQRAALEFVIEHSFNDEAFGLTPELISYMTVDKWSDSSPGDRGDPTWAVHDAVSGIQISALTMVLNPTTLRRVYDNEFRTPADQDAVTIPELLDAIVDASFGELNGDGGAKYDVRHPMITSFRRNLQTGVVERLASLATTSNRMPPAVGSVCRDHLRELDSMITEWTSPNRLRKIDRYTAAHLRDLKDTIDAAFERVEIKE